MNVIFLDYDDVVNTPQWYYNDKTSKWVLSYWYPKDNCVNNCQAVQWVSEFCQKYNYSIVVTSTWRRHINYKNCLINAGLRDGIEVIGATPIIDYAERGDEITAWLKSHSDIENYLIFDDEDDMTIHMKHLVQCKGFNGFGYDEYQLAKDKHIKGDAKNE